MSDLKFEKNFDAEQTESFQSFAETLAFIVGDVYGSAENYKLFTDQYPRSENGYIEHLNVLIDYARKFEKLNENKEWDGEWYEELEKFINEQLKP